MINVCEKLGVILGEVSSLKFHHLLKAHLAVEVSIEETLTVAPGLEFN